MQEGEDSLLNRLIVGLPRNLDLACEQRIAASIFERPQVLAVCRSVDAKEAANESSPYSRPIGEDDHRPVPVRQTPFIQASKQGLDFGDITNLAAQDIKADVFLKHGSHPFEGDLPRTLHQKELTPQRCYCAFDCTQTDGDVLLSRQFLAHRIRVARMEAKTLAQPV